MGVQNKNCLSWLGRFLRRIFGCSFGTHYRPEYIEDDSNWGISRGGRCLDCGYSWEPIKWPRMPECKEPRISETKYYEIICDVGVIGTCSDSGKGDDTLLHCAREDNVIAFGEISEADFNRFLDSDNGWTEPISKKRWKPIIKIVLELEEIKVI